MKPLRILGVVIALAVLFWFLPLFHVVPLEGTRDQAAAGEFDAVTFTDELWQGALQDAAEGAVDATVLLDALRDDPAKAAEEYGHRLGLGGNVFYFVQAQGDIAAVEPFQMRIALVGDSRQVVVEKGPVFGNAVRDGSGLLDVSQFSNAQDFNAISSEINRRVEEEILPRLEADAKVGATVHIVGGVEVPDSTGAPESLTIVPVRVEFP